MEENQITIQDFMDVVHYRITAGYEYQWFDVFPNHCFALESNIDNQYQINIVFDKVNNNVYVVEAWDERKDVQFRWINPLYLDEYKAEFKKRRFNFKESIDHKMFIDLELAEDFLEKARAIVDNKTYDNRVQVPLEMDESEIFTLMKIAHERDITLNQLVEEILTEAIKKDITHV